MAEVTDPELINELNQGGKRQPIPSFGEAKMPTNIPQRPPAQGWEAVKKDAIQGLLRTPSALGEAVEGTLEAVPTILTHGLNEPGKFAANLAGGAALNLPQLLWDAPDKLASYLSDRGVLSPEAGEQARGRIGPNLAQKFLGDRPQDIATQQLGTFLPLAPLAVGAPIRTGIGISVLEGQNPIVGAAGGAVTKVGIKGGRKALEIARNYKQKGQLNEGLKVLEKEAVDAQKELVKLEDRVKAAGEGEAGPLQELQEAQEYYETVKRELADLTMEHQIQANELTDVKRGVSKQSPETLADSVRTAQDKLKALQEESAGFPDTSKLPEYESIYEQSKGNLEKQGKEIQSLESDINKRFGEGLAVDERIAKHVFKEQEGIQKSIDNEYKAINKEAEQFEVPFGKSKELAQLETDLRKITPNVEKADFEGFLEKAAAELNINTKTNTVNGKELLEKWRSLRNSGYDLKREAKKHGGTEEGANLYKAGDAALSEANKLLQLFEQNVPPEVFQRLMKNNERFVNEVVPVRQNPVWGEISKHKRIAGDDLIHKLRGEGPGSEILRNIIMRDPAMSELMLGTQLRGKKPETWHDIHESRSPYLEAASPEMKQTLGSHREALERQKQVTETHKGAEEQIKKLSPVRKKQIESEKQANKLMEGIQAKTKQIEELKKQRAAVEEQAKKTSAAQKQKIAAGKKTLEAKRGMEEARAKYGAKQAETKQAEQELKKGQEKYKSPLEEKMRIENEIKKLEKQASDDRAKLMNLALKGVAIKTGKDVLSMLFR